jgi:hypothetical protein
MMAAANIPLTVRCKIWKKAAKTAALLDGLMTVKINDSVKLRYQHAFGHNPSFVEHLRTVGEAGTVKMKNQGTPKLANRGVACICSLDTRPVMKEIVIVCGIPSQMEFTLHVPSFG